MSPSQASETCASASSATSARCRVGHYANASGGCQESADYTASLSVLTPIDCRRQSAIAVAISIASATVTRSKSRSRFRRLRLKIFVKPRIAIRSPTIPTPITRVMAVNKLFDTSYPSARLCGRVPGPWRQSTAPKIITRPSTKIPNKFLEVESFIKFLLKIIGL